MGMANSLEIRVPFLDHQLIEFVLSVPDKYKVGAHQKQLLLDSVSGGFRMKSWIERKWVLFFQ